MRYAIIRDGAVVNIALWDGITPWSPGAGLLVVLAPAGVDIGWLYDGQFSPPPPAEPEEI
jgi:hypothetical protein